MDHIACSANPQTILRIKSSIKIIYFFLITLSTMTTITNHEEASDAPLSSPLTKRKRKQIMIVLVVLIGIIIIVAIVISQIPTEKYRFIGEQGTFYYTTHSPSGNSTIITPYRNDSFRVVYDSNEPVYLNWPFYHNASGGTALASNFVCNVPGFSLKNSSISFPFSVPTALNASQTNNNLIVRLTFNAPSTPYSGPFIFSIYYDYYP